MLFKTHLVLSFGILAWLIGSMETDRLRAGEKECLLLSSERLKTAKKAVENNDPAVQEAVDDLKEKADALLRLKNFPSVTDNDYVAPGGTKNDYVSFATYWWPDPSKPDGLPFIRRDGHFNREQLSTEKGHDSPAMATMVRSVKTLALAFYLTGNESYGREAVRFLRCWFLDPETRMNPHLEYGQAIPGRTHGRGIGIIDTKILSDLIAAIELLDTCEAWTRKDRDGVKQWFGDFLVWLLESNHGKSEREEKNNHGTWYDVQVATFACFAGKKSIAVETLERSKDRIDTQIEKDGSQPLELARTRPFHYSTMNLCAFMRLANLGERFGVDLWGYTGKRGGTVHAAFEYLLPYSRGKVWPHDDLGFDPSYFNTAIYLIGGRFGGHYENRHPYLKEFELEMFYR